MTTEKELQEVVADAAGRLHVPGVAVGVALRDETHAAYHGVTSVEDPLPVDAGTLFQIGSTGKTYTATAILQLVEQGRIDLDAPVRTYVPELRLKDEQVARDVTILHLLNHTAGWDGDFFRETGEGDDALERYVEHMSDIQQVTPLGASVSYNNASLALAGLVLQRVTGSPFEQVIHEQLLEPLGMEHSFYFAKQIMTHRFSQGHTQSQDGAIAVVRPWDTGRWDAPMGGMASNVGDQLAWARFAMSDGRAPDGTQLVSEQHLRDMVTPTVECRGSALGDAVGISWFQRDIDGARVVGHGGDTAGQHSYLEMIPEHRLAFTSLTNCGPNGSEFNEEIMRWVFEAYAGVVMTDPEPEHLTEDALAEYVGRYDTIAVICHVSLADGRLIISYEYVPEVLAELGEEEPDEPDDPIGLLPGEGDRYVVTDGPMKGMLGYFSRDANGAIDGLHIGGRFATRAL